MTLISQRLSQQWLSSSLLTWAVDVVQHFGCMQAQDYHWATRAIGIRSGQSYQTITETIAQWKIIRTRPMRGTIHFLLPQNVHWMMDLCASKMLGSFAWRREYLWISDKQATTALDLLDEMLRGGKQMTRKQIAHYWEDKWIALKKQRIYHLLNYAATKKLICFGPRKGNEDTFVLLNEWVNKPLQPTREEALIKLATMFFRAHGPATVDDMARWTKLGKTDCRQWIAWAWKMLIQQEYEGKTYIATPPTWGEKTWHQSWEIFFLWAYDEFFLGYKDKLWNSLAIHQTQYAKNGTFWPLVVVDGNIAGTRKRTLLKDKIRIQINHLDQNIALSSSHMEKAAHSYAQFLWINTIEII